MINPMTAPRMMNGIHPSAIIHNWSTEDCSVYMTKSSSHALLTVPQDSHSESANRDTWEQVTVK